MMDTTLVHIIRSVIGFIYILRIYVFDGVSYFSTNT